jgi:hypothetical protein
MPRRRFSACRRSNATRVCAAIGLPFSSASNRVQPHATRTVLSAKGHAIWYSRAGVKQRTARTDPERLRTEFSALTRVPYRARGPNAADRNRIRDQGKGCSESESSINGSIPTAYWSSCKPMPEKKADFRRFCRALWRTRTADPSLRWRSFGGHARSHAITRGTVFPANQTDSAAPDVSRGVARVVVRSRVK